MCGSTAITCWHPRGLFVVGQADRNKARSSHANDEGTHLGNRVDFDLAALLRTCPDGPCHTGDGRGYSLSDLFFGDIDRSYHYLIASVASERKLQHTQTFLREVRRCYPCSVTSDGCVAHFRSSTRASLHVHRAMRMFWRWRRFWR